MGSGPKQDRLWQSLMLANWLPWLGVPVPTALATALDVGLSNWSFLYITVSL